MKKQKEKMKAAFQLLPKPIETQMDLLNIRSSEEEFHNIRNKERKSNSSK
jgi:hypothetical protein